MLTYKNFRWSILVFFLLIFALRFYFSRPIRTYWFYSEAYVMRFQWLDSVNLYLKSGKILMYPPQERLEDVSTGEDQGYPFILSILGNLTGKKEMTFATFVRFNYLFLITLGIISSILLFLTFDHIAIALIFFYFYLRLDIYSGGLDHHWMLGALLPFYISFLMFYIYSRQKLSAFWLIFYLGVAGLANIIREGYGVIGIMILVGVGFMIWVIEKLKWRQVFRVQNLVWGVIFWVIYSAPGWTLDRVRNFRNQIYFDRQASIMITHHGLWHNAFMGLGYVPNKYGIIWNDANNLPFVRQVNQQANYMTNEYFSILGSLYFKYALADPGFWWTNYLAKIISIQQFIASLFPHELKSFFPPFVRLLAFYVILLTTWRLSRSNKTRLLLTSLILISLVASSLPGIIGLPAQAYLRGLQSAYFMTWIYLFILLYLEFMSKFRRHYV
ncbi:MAG: hypothetical protein UV55_C0004G0005 [Candidatus Gottesmanbacteria bacterium GW2011_GWC1_43_10]|nr:MAG: hypothetical protein UV55_C0004G0005 [Candidatus Gottesmanbacteria bacterium GW2011_GWC1_43_10]